MIQCVTCGHQNLPTYSTCSKCGEPLGADSATGTAAAGGADAEYARMMAQRAAAAKRKKVIYLAVILGVVGLFGFKWVQDSGRKKETQAKLDFAGRWAEMEKRETGLFWNCVMASEVDVGLFSTADQIQQRIETAYFTQQKTFSEHLRTECVPKLERARQAMASLADAPDELKPPLDAYRASLPKLQNGIELYADRIMNRATSKDVDQLVQEYGNAWHSEQRPTPETIAFDKFMQCAIPNLDKMKDAQAMLEYLADACFKKDPVAFMDRVRKDCGSLLQEVDPKAAPSKTYKVSQKKFYEEDARQLSAWSDCARRSRKGKKVEDLEDFLLAVGDYMKSRAEMVQVARSIMNPE
jgi:hypothetical protein